MGDSIDGNYVDYGALRRSLVEESPMSRADGVYRGTGGRLHDVEPPKDDQDDAQSSNRAMRTPILSTARSDITLAPFGPAHHAGLLKAADDQRIARCLSDRFPYPYTEDDADAWIALCIAQDPPLHFAILVGDKLAGAVGCEPKTDLLLGTAELGWWLAPRWWGQGVAAVAAARLVEYCFEDLELHRVEAGVFVSNPASARVAEKAGFELEGVSRDAYLKDGELIDRLSYGLARSASGSRVTRHSDLQAESR